MKREENEERLKEKTIEYSMKNVNKEAVEKFARYLKIITQVILTPMVIAIIGIVFVAIFFIISMFSTIRNRTNVNVTKKLREYYNESFVVVAKQIDNKKNGVYKVSPNSNKGIVFTVTKNSGGLDNDYLDVALKYYIEHCEQEELTKDIEIQTTIRRNSYFPEVEFLSCRVFLEINGYEEIEEKTTQIYHLQQYLNERMKVPYILGSVIKKEDYNSEVRYEQEYTLKELIDKEKKEYINYVIANHLDITEIPEEERILVK